MSHAFEQFFSTLSVIDKNSLEKCKLQKGCGCLQEAFSPAAEHYSVCTACKVPLKGPEESISEVIITHFFTENWRCRSCWICLPESPTAADEIIILHISQHRATNNKPSPNETTPFPKQFSHISTQIHPCYKLASQMPWWLQHISSVVHSLQPSVAFILLAQNTDGCWTKHSSFCFSKAGLHRFLFLYRYPHCEFFKGYLVAF